MVLKHLIKNTLIFSVFLGVLSGCNPLGISTSIDSNFHPGISNASLVDQVDDDGSVNGFGGGTAVGVSSFGALVGASGSGLKLGSHSGCDGSTQNCNDFTVNPPPAWTSIVGYWKLDEPVSTSAPNSVLDSGPVGINSGSPSGGVTFGDPGKIKTAVTFDGSGSSRIHLGSDASLQITGLVSIQAWVNASLLNNTTTQNIVEEVNAQGSIYMRKKFQYYQCGTYSSATDYYSGYESTPAELGQWVHLVCVYDGTHWILYRNGVSVQNDTPMASGSMPTGNGDWMMGEQWNGSIDDVAIWKGVALSPTQVAVLYQNELSSHAGYFTSRVMDSVIEGAPWTSLTWTPTLPFFKALPDFVSGTNHNETSAHYTSLVTDHLMDDVLAVWHFDETTGTTTRDTSGNHYDLTANSVTYGVPGKLGSAHEFDGVSSYEGVMNDDLGFDGDHTICTWFSTTDTGGQAIVTRNGNLTTNYSLVVDGNGKLTTQLWFSTSFSSPYIASPNTVNDGKWHHGCEVYDSSGRTQTLYLDGDISVATTPTNGVGFLKEDGDITCVGQYSLSANCSSTNFKGKLDEIVMWKRVVSAAEITQLYQRGASRIKFQARSCLTPDCSGIGDAWKGPDGTNTSYFSELNNLSIQAVVSSGTVNTDLPSILLQNYSTPVPSRRYFQYRTFFESDSSSPALMPELKRVSVGPNR